ncbi:hypothetical protein OESDEN_17863 [Oesophagostomum dentatum]|uniref:Uncharacterized protein n=1 Tax=Oesophagostomum dentatum TaxID=61180 RepID=A0A0B1SAV4_OESDE|nr:hypothetical protein OESDEN_17863 [Oesophagostomum dentatum]
MRACGLLMNNRKGLEDSSALQSLYIVALKQHLRVRNSPFKELSLAL